MTIPNIELIEAMNEFLIWQDLDIDDELLEIKGISDLIINEYRKDIEKIFNELQMEYWNEVCLRFEEEVLPHVVITYEKDGQKDLPARRQAWCDWTDQLCKNGNISDWENSNWDHPNCNE